LSITVTELPGATRLIVRGGDVAVGIIGRAFGVGLPRDPCRAKGSDDRAALWLGPDEWLLIAPDGEAERLSLGLAQAIGEEPASIVDVSHRQVGIAVAGPAAADALNTSNALDLDESAFPIGMCTRTLFGKAEIVLWRTGREAFRIEVWRSFAPYVLGCLEQAISDPSLMV
jgi:sarcosine oxidase subunit gamma